ncbi:glycosyltransferase [Sphingomonas quercus]|uniref:Glycosyltransferase n=1 Tax=Sphingomonas quercus TaxID=2842451 RepID=A0ABS6BHA8_9SPHN|nr:glycosyltransferase [Sphingomonas quercus]MBU3077186.1 glycosyltransferase [Sphingomonas quercus]
MSRPTILHLAVDFNTPQRPRTTTAIEWFVEALDADFDNVVVAYLRRSRPGGLTAQLCESGHARLYHFPFFGLPLGLGLLPAMRAAARRTIRRLEQDGIRPDLVHAHKLTFEGLAGWYVARHFGVPLFISLRGEVETKVFRMKPNLRGFLRRLCADAARLYFVSAWFRDEYHRYVPAQPDKERLLPNIVRNIAPTIEPQPAGDRFVCVMNLDTWKRKGLRWLLEGFARAAASEPALRLDIIGGGSAQSRGIAERMIAEAGLSQRVTLVGRLANAELLARLPGYRGLLMPSLNETFGMVYVEALFAGIPILFTQGTAIDGYLDGLDVAHAVPPRDAAAIASAVLDMHRRNDGLRANIAAAAPRLFRTFDPAAALAAYAADVRAAIGRKA